MAKTAPTRFDTVVYVTMSALRHIAILAQPFMPAATAELLDQLGVSKSQRDFAALAEPLASEVTLPPPQPIFRRVDPSS